jgi:hypothetical protein
MPAGGRAAGVRFAAAGALLRGRPHRARGRRRLELRGRRALRLRQFGLLAGLPCSAPIASPLAGAGGESDAGGGAEVGGMGERERAGGSRWEGAVGRAKRKGEDKWMTSGPRAGLLG